MTTLRERYLPIIQELSKRIDDASYKYVMTGSETYLNEYNDLTFEMIEIKTAIKKEEEDEEL